MQDALFELKNLSKGYQSGDRFRHVLKDVDFQIQKGEIVVLLGKSGSGKSTLLNLLSGMDEADKGQIMVNGTDLQSLSDNQKTTFRREQVGFVFQFFNLIPTLTVGENLAFPMVINNQDNQTQESRITELLTAVGLADRRHDYPEQLSGGEQQRIALARAFAHNPSIILADEPTGNLDADTSDTIIALMKDLVKSQGKTMLVATHSASLLPIADRVIEIKNGQIREKVQA